MCTKAIAKFQTSRLRCSTEMRNKAPFAKMVFSSSVILYDLANNRVSFTVNHLVFFLVLAASSMSLCFILWRSTFSKIFANGPSRTVFGISLFFSRAKASIFFSGPVKATETSCNKRVSLVLIALPVEELIGIGVENQAGFSKFQPPPIKFCSTPDIMPNRPKTAKSISRFLFLFSKRPNCEIMTSVFITSTKVMSRVNFILYHDPPKRRSDAIWNCLRWLYEVLTVRLFFIMASRSTYMTFTLCL